MLKPKQGNYDVSPPYAQVHMRGLEAGGCGSGRCTCSSVW